MRHLIYFPTSFLSWDVFSALKPRNKALLNALRALKFYMVLDNFCHLEMWKHSIHRFYKPKGAKVQQTFLCDVFFLKNDSLAKPSSTVAKVIRKQIIANFRKHFKLSLCFQKCEEWDVSQNNFLNNCFWMWFFRNSYTCMRLSKILSAI